MKQSDNIINPFVRLVIDTENNYVLEIILPISSAVDKVAILANGAFEASPKERFPAHVNYEVHLSTSEVFSDTQYTKFTVNLEPNSDSRGILVRVSDPSIPSHLKGPKADGKTIIQFEDAER